MPMPKPNTSHTQKPSCVPPHKALLCGGPRGRGCRRKATGGISTLSLALSDTNLHAAAPSLPLGEGGAKRRMRVLFPPKNRGAAFAAPPPFTQPLQLHGLDADAAQPTCCIPKAPLPKGGCRHSRLGDSGFTKNKAAPVIARRLAPKQSRRLTLSVLKKWRMPPPSSPRCSLTSNTGWIASRRSQ